MMSLDNAFDESELGAWFERVAKESKVNTWLCEVKVDGLAINLLYEQSKLVRALTRGNGVTGEDVTLNIKTIREIPHQLITKPEIPDGFTMFLHNILNSSLLEEIPVILTPNGIELRILIF
jgi:DNA ligase (NAD+)